MREGQVILSFFRWTRRLASRQLCQIEGLISKRVIHVETLFFFDASLDRGQLGCVSTLQMVQLSDQWLVLRSLRFLQATILAPRPAALLLLRWRGRATAVAFLSSRLTLLLLDGLLQLVHVANDLLI